MATRRCDNELDARLRLRRDGTHGSTVRDLHVGVVMPTPGIAGSFAATRLALVVARRALPQLVDDATGVVDLEAITCTRQP